MKSNLVGIFTDHSVCGAALVLESAVWRHRHLEGTLCGHEALYEALPAALLLVPTPRRGMQWAEASRLLDIGTVMLLGAGKARHGRRKSR